MQDLVETFSAVGSELDVVCEGGWDDEKEEGEEGGESEGVGGGEEMHRGTVALLWGLQKTEVRLLMRML